MAAALERRRFLAAAGAATVGAAWARPAEGTRLRLGAPVGGTEDPEALARAHRAKGYRAAYCPPLRLDDRARIRATAEAFARHDVVVAEVGRWVNLLDADPDARRRNLATVTEGLALAEAVGARCCVDIAGSFSTTSWFGPHPDNLSARFFDAAVENARRILDAVKPTRTTFCYEMMAWSLPDSPDACLRLVEAVDRPAFAVHLDPCNLVSSPERYYRSADLVRESVRPTSCASATRSSARGSRASTSRTSLGRSRWPSTSARSAPARARSTTQRGSWSTRDTARTSR